MELADVYRRPANHLKSASTKWPQSCAPSVGGDLSVESGSIYNGARIDSDAIGCYLDIWLARGCYFEARKSVYHRPSTRTIMGAIRRGRTCRGLQLKLVVFKPSMHPACRAIAGIMQQLRFIFCPYCGRSQSEAAAGSD